MTRNTESEPAPRARLGDIIVFGVPRKINRGKSGYSPVYFDGDFWTIRTKGKNMFDSSMPKVGVATLPDIWSLPFINGDATRELLKRALS